MTYLLIGGALLVGALAIRVVAEVVVRRRGEHIPLVPTLVAAAVLVVLTAVFDTIMIASGLFVYAEAHLWGPKVGLAPIEDFTYPLALAIALPGVWALSGRRAAR